MASSARASRWRGPSGRPSTAAGSAAAARPEFGREDPAFEARPGPGRRQRPVHGYDPVGLERAEPPEQARATLRRGEVPGGSRTGRELVEQIERHHVCAAGAAIGGTCRRPLDDQLEPFEHPRREHRPEHERRRDEIVAGDPPRERQRQRWQQRPVGSHARRQRLRLDPLGFGRVAQDDGQRLAAAELDDHRLTGLDIHERIRHRIRVRPHATGPRCVDRHLDEPAGPAGHRFGGRGLEAELELHS